MPRVITSALNDDVLLNIFDWFRLYNTTIDDQGWDLERWWYTPIHVCRSWRHLIITSPIRLDLISFARMVSLSKTCSYIRRPYLL